MPTAVSPPHDHVLLLVQTVLTTMEHIIDSENVKEESDEAGRSLNTAGSTTSSRLLRG